MYFWPCILYWSSQLISFWTKSVSDEQSLKLFSFSFVSLNELRLSSMTRSAYIFHINDTFRILASFHIFYKFITIAIFIYGCKWTKSHALMHAHIHRDKKYVYLCIGVSFTFRYGFLYFMNKIRRRCYWILTFMKDLLKVITEWLIICLRYFWNFT